MDETLEKRVEDAIWEEISIVPYSPEWPRSFENESNVLRNMLPESLLKRIEDLGSTAIPGIAAKPVIDMLVEVISLEETKRQIVPLLQSKGYDYFWCSAVGNPSDYYAWFIKRDTDSKRTHHIHMVEADSELWDGPYFRDYLRKFPREANLIYSSSATLPDLLVRRACPTHWSGGEVREDTLMILGSSSI